ncbi:MAG: response regulator, partial [Magnetococcales bacterium]|nr:response regulator [Magnetococcales bacterium]
DNILRHSTNVAIVATDPDWCIRYFNPMAEKLFGISQEEVIGKWLDQHPAMEPINPFRFGSKTSPLPESGLLEYEREYPLHHRTIILSVRITRIPDRAGNGIGYVFMARDITEVRRAEIYREKNEQRLAMLLEMNRKAPGLSEKELCTLAVDIAVSLTDSRIGYLHRVNADQETIRLVTWNAATLEHCNAVHASHYPISRAGIWADSFRLKKTVVHNNCPSEPGLHGYPEGHFPVLRHMSTPLMENGKVCFILGVGNKGLPYDQNDITQLERVGDEVQRFLMRWQAEEALREARQAAEAANLAKSEFLAIMSHEIRTPLNVLLGMSDILEESVLTSEQRQQLEVVNRAGEHLLSLINDILDLSRIEIGRLVLENVAYQPRSLLSAVENMMRSRIETKGLQFQVTLSPDLPMWVSGDEARLRQILVNLLGNAVKFTQQGHIALNVEYAPQGNLCRFSLSDTGEGIAEEHLDKIFDKFTQADASISRRHGGTGLGLAISRNLVERMGGQLKVESRLGEGSTFSFTIAMPVVEAPDSTVARTAPPPLTELSPLHILLVEDSPDNQNLIRTYLKKTPWTIETVQNGQEAVDCVPRGQYDLILMDIQMPVMDGYTATRMIRAWEQRESRKPLPILALSAHALQSEQQMSLQAGCDAHLVKPIKKSHLISTIWGVMSKL